jgi:histidinol-phosphate/aromatic aminotransferase/cobyric acid decarboxylase-like protein
LPSKTTFVCFKVGDGEGVSRWLKANGVCVKVAYGMSEWLRVGVGTHDMNKKFIETMRRYLKESRRLKIEAK